MKWIQTRLHIPPSQTGYELFTSEEKVFTLLNFHLEPLYVSVDHLYFCRHQGKPQQTYQQLRFVLTKNVTMSVIAD